MQIDELWKKIHKVRDMREAGYSVDGIVAAGSFPESVVRELLQTSKILNSGAGHTAEWGDASPPQEVAHTPAGSAVNG